MNFSFLSFGHPNITAKHKNTLEFTKGKELGLEGDCIIGVDSDFDFKKLKKFIKKADKVKIIIEVDGLKEEISCEINPDFDDAQEIVIRKSEFNSKRTLGVKADKACKDLSREFRENLSKDSQRIKVSITLK